MKVGVAGLGSMGAAMAGRLATGGHTVIGFDLAAGRAHALGLEPAQSLADLSGAQALLLSLPDSDAVEAVLLGESSPVLTADGPRLVVDTSTIDPNAGVAIGRRLAEHGVVYVDAPVSGGPAGARSGTLTVMVGGDDDAIAAAGAILSAIAGKVIRCGATGTGQAVKLINNFLVATHLGAARVALRVADTSGLDRERLLAAINACSGRSAVTEVNVPTWICNGAFDSGFTMALMRKDVGLARSFAAALGCDEPFVGAVHALWRDASIDDDEDFNRIADPVPAERN